MCGSVFADSAIEFHNFIDMTRESITRPFLVFKNNNQ